MHLLRSAAVQYTNYGTGGAFELPTQSGTYIYTCVQALIAVVEAKCAFMDTYNL